MVADHLLPDPDSVQPVSWDGLRQVVPHTEKLPRVSTERVMELCSLAPLKREFEDMSRDLFPPRTKSDVSLRRTRMRDWVTIYSRAGRENDCVDILSSLADGSDLIFSTNILAAVWVFGLDWFNRWKGVGAFDGDIGHFVSVTKKVHDIVKTQGLDDENWLEYVECNVLTGYRSLPFPGFDVFAESEKLAHGGIEHEYFGRTFRSLVEKYLPISPVPVEWVPFDEWVMQGDWLTSGASSVGYLQVVVDGKSKRIKARKNMVADVVDLKELALHAMSDDGQYNRTVIKSELGKVRLAVAGDLYTYLKMTWVNRLLGGAYYQWPGNTSEESFVEQTKRMHRMLKLCTTMLGLPYDYKSFDHQPLLEELVMIVEHLIHSARANVPDHGTAQFDNIAQSIVSGFHHATLETVFEGESRTWSVLGGLMSGLRWTSVVGNAWNSVMTGLVLEILQSWGITTDQIERFIRGDDSAIFVPNWATGAAANLAYQSIGVQAGQGKFSLQRGKMEFLRVWYDHSCHGYPVRSIPGLVQRKPWSNQPWSEDMIMRALYDAFGTIRRRCPRTSQPCQMAWEALRNMWARNHNVPVAVFKTPTTSGGLGIEPTPAGWHYQCTPAMPRVDPSSYFAVVGQTRWRADRLERYASQKYGIDITGLSASIADAELKANIVSDNIPSVASSVRQKWLKEIRTARIKVTKTKVQFGNVDVPWDIDAFPLSEVQSLMDQLHAQAPLFGACPEVAVAKVDYARFQFPGTFSSFLRAHFPRCYSLLRRFHKSWHISESLAYLQGKIEVSTVALHPALKGILALWVAAVMKPSKKVERCKSLWLGSLFEPILQRTELAHTLYSW